MFNKIVKILKNIVNKVNIYIINPSTKMLEDIVVKILGYEVWYNVIKHLNYLKFFYSVLWNRIIRELIILYEDILIECIWIIKRSSNPICKALKKILSKYDWFNNNIIKF